MRTRILRGGGRWDEVGPVWRELAAGQPVATFMRSTAWAEAITEVGQGDNARWVLMEDDDGPLAALPLDVRPRRRGPLRMRILTNDRTADGLVADRARPADLRAAVLAAMAAAGEPIDVIDLHGLRDGWGLLRLAVAGPHGLVTEHNHGGHSVLATDLSAESWSASMGKNLRGSLRKARNRFERRGEMTVTEATEPGAVDAAFDEFVAIESSGWKADRGALANRPAQQAAIRRFLRTGAGEGSVAVRTLRLDGRPAAAQITFVAEGTLDVLKVAYDEGIADLSPSNLLMADLVRVCCDRPDVDRIDLVTRQPWHERWHPEPLPTYRSRDPNPRRPAGAALLAVSAVQQIRSG